MRIPEGGRNSKYKGPEEGAGQAAKGSGKAADRAWRVVREGRVAGDKAEIMQDQVTRTCRTLYGKWLSYREGPKMLDGFQQSRDTTDYRNRKGWKLADQLGGFCSNPRKGTVPWTTVVTEEVVRRSQISFEGGACKMCRQTSCGR